MSRRATKRRWAILGVLHEHGRLYAADIAQLVHRSNGLTRRDLAVLAELGRVVAERDRAPEGLGREVWRVTTAAERDQHASRGPRPRRVVVVDTRRPRMRTAPTTAAAGA